MSKNKKRVAVYGSLRKGLGNYARHLSSATHLGDFQTTPVFDMYSLGGYPGLKLKGSTPIYMEVYEVDDKELDGINMLEGYDPNSDHNDFYNRVVISTPYGEAYTYIYQGDIKNNIKVESGDWKDFLQSGGNRPKTETVTVPTE